MNTPQSGDLSQVPFRDFGMKQAAVSVDQRPDGTLLIRHPDPMHKPRRSIVEYLRHWAEVAPARTMLAARAGDEGWSTISYAEMRRQSDAVAQALLNLGLRPGDHIMILSSASLEHAVLLWAAMTIGIVVAPISPHYSLIPDARERLRSIYSLLKPRLIFVQNAGIFAPALDSLRPLDAIVVAAAGADRHRGAVSFSSLTETALGEDVEQAFSAVGPETIAKILFTSGSTGAPKGVINTQLMLCANQAMLDGLERNGGEREDPPLTMSWQPWHHTMAGNATINRTIRQGGTYYIDDGGPTPGRFARTLANLRTLSPTGYSDVPIGWTMLVEALETDMAFRASFFARLETITFAGASLPSSIWTRLQCLAVAETGFRIPVIVGLGSTETAPALLVLTWPVEGTGYVGLPIPGVDIKLVPLGSGRFELRARGPSITPGYLHAPELTAAAFDEEGFYQLGDAVSFADPESYSQGLKFAGRIAEDFKLSTGTWVSAGIVRPRILTASPLIQDVAIAGLDRDAIGLLVWPNVARCRAHLSADLECLADTDVVVRDEVVAAITQSLQAYNRLYPTSSNCVDRFRLMTEPPSLQHGEITDKGYLNQAVTLRNRDADVAALYSPSPAAPTYVVGRS